MRRVLPVLREFEAPPEIPHDYAGPMTAKIAKAIAGSLGKTSKMPGFSYGISAEKCQTGGKLRGVPGSVCSACYALTDWYRTWRPLLEGHRRRWQGIHHPLWVRAMVFQIERACRRPEDRFFRWHDSGDLQGVWHLENIAQVCRCTPAVQHWLPTREYEFVAEYLRREYQPTNLVIRLSAHMIDTEPVVPPDLAHLPTSTVSTVSRYTSGVAIVEGKGSVECRAVAERDNKCGPCRACWSTDVNNVSYPQH